jgi:hypothetical protein
MVQVASVVGSPGLNSRVIARRRQFDSLFDGFHRLQAISFVVSPDLLLAFFEERRFEEIEIVVGENLTEQYRQTLSQKGQKVTQALAELIEHGKLKILVPKHTIHSKLYILHRDEDVCRVIQGSANLTETARRGTSQVNYVWYGDFADDDPWLARVLDDYRAHLQDCSLFMGDLVELFRRRPEEDRGDLVDAWLKGRVAEDDELGERRFLQQLTARSLESLREPDAEPIFAVELPNAPKVRQRLETRLATLSPLVTGRHMQLNAANVVRYVQENHSVPPMLVDLVSRRVTIGIDGVALIRSEPPSDAESIDRALQHIEDYVNTVDWGRGQDPLFAKTSMYEALLYFLAAPFAHEHMKSRRRRHALVDSRGPRVLHVFGHAQNGKSTFLKFALHLLVGRHVAPIAGSQFTKTRIRSAAALGSSFPLTFDDLDLSGKSKPFEEVLKSYWEVWWREDCVCPQIVLTGNTENFKEWAKSRLKRIDFDVQFAPSAKEKEELNKILEVDNPLFKWFSFLYMDHLARGVSPGEDELSIARDVMKNLYDRAHRALPAFFPEQPIECLYDPGRRAWQDLLHGLRKASAVKDGTRRLIAFKDDMQYAEIRAYAGHLPQTVKHKVKGKTIVVESPREFEEWLGNGRSRPESWFKRFMPRRQGK